LRYNWGGRAILSTICCCCNIWR